MKVENDPPLKVLLLELTFPREAEVGFELPLQSRASSGLTQQWVAIRDTSLYHITFTVNKNFHLNISLHVRRFRDRRVFRLNLLYCCVKRRVIYEQRVVAGEVARRLGILSVAHRSQAQNQKNCLRHPSHLSLASNAYAARRRSSSALMNSSMSPSSTASTSPRSTFVRASLTKR